jgi:hypothetical protein
MGTGKPWDAISIAAGAAGGAVAALIIKHLGELLVSILQLWTARIRMKLPKTD